MTTWILDGLWGNRWRFGGLKRRLVAAGLGRVEIFSYDASGFGCLETAGARLAEVVQSVGGPVNLIGYSMGGLVIRACAANHNTLPIRKAVFMNTPHHGSVLANLVPGKGFAQMRPNGPLLKKLDCMDWVYPTLAVWTPGDLMVLPGSSACWEKAQQKLKCEIPAHVWPVFSKSIHARVAEFLLEESK